MHRAPCHERVLAGHGPSKRRRIGGPVNAPHSGPFSARFRIYKCSCLRAARYAADGKGADCLDQTVDWNASAYHQLSEPHVAWGEQVLARLPLRGDERAIDVGCGTGRLTARLLERLPRGFVLGIDLSENMLEVARRELLPRFGERVRLERQDVLKLQVDAPVDVVFSTATFHWVLDQKALYGALLGALKPGGRLEAQYGGEGNLRGIRDRAQQTIEKLNLGARFADFTEPWVYPRADMLQAHLESSGWKDVRAWLEPAPTTFEDAATYRAFLRDVVLRHHVARLSAAEAEAFLDALTEAARYDKRRFTLDYVRLNVSARRR